MLTRGIIRFGINTRMGMRNTTSGSRRASSSAPLLFLPGGEMTPFLKNVLWVVFGGGTGVGGCVINFGPALKEQNSIMKAQDKRFVKLEKDITDINKDVADIKTDIAGSKENSKTTSENTKYIRDRLDRRWF